jgi:hypothetical protein
MLYDITFTGQIKAVGYENRGYNRPGCDMFCQQLVGKDRSGVEMRLIPPTASISACSARQVGKTTF